MKRGEGLTVELEHDRLSFNPNLCHHAVTRVFDGEGAQIEDVTVVLTGHETVRRLNSRYLGHDFNTDVLAFRYSEPESGLEGEIYVDLDTAAERHEEFGASYEEEVLRYTIHGALHLTGYTDADDASKQRMHMLEDRYLDESDFNNYT